MNDKVILLQDWISKQPAALDEHLKMQQRLQSIVDGYQAEMAKKDKRIAQLESQLNNQDHDHAEEE